ncbi:hypothetical protein FRC04_000947 [Tulasnella sp. 424]|nr:hypothetical protein FRC04_000947 [Tulasnella sp. 424]KAG8977861.1 hypothetical protein FRC05_000389 [Tulasnella sp. 425]
MPADTSMPYRPGSTPQSAGPPRQTQGPSLQQSTQQHDRNVRGGPEISGALSEDERRSDDAVFRRRDAQGTGFTSDRRSNGAPIPAVLPPKLAAPSKSNLGDSHVAQPTGFGDPPMRMMPSPTFMPADTSMPYRPGSTPQSAGPPRQTQGPSLQQSTQQHDRNVRGGSEISWALSEDERRSDDAVFRRRDAQGTGFTSDRRSNGAPIPAVLSPKLAAPSESYLGDSHVVQPTGFGDPPMRMMPSPTFMPADTSMPYRPGSTPQSAGPPGLGDPPMRTTSPTATPANTSIPYRPGSTPQSAGPSQQAQGGSPQQCTHQHNQSVGGGSKVSWAMSKVQKKIQQFEQKVQQFDFQEAGLQLYDTLLVVQQNIELANSIVQTGTSLSDSLASQ